MGYNHQSSRLMIIYNPEKVELDDQFNGQLIIRWEEGEEKQKKIGCLFKLKTNNFENIEAKPSHGLILLGKNSQKSCIKIKYKGHLIQIDKAKLKIQWLNLEEKDLERIKEMQNVNLPIIYKTIRNQLPNCQKSHTLSFALQKEPENGGLINEFRYEDKKIEEAELPTIKEEYHQKIQSLEKQGIYKATKLQNIKEDKEVQSTETAQVIFSTPVSLIFLIALGFLLGLSFGIKTSQFSFSYDIVQHY